MRLGRTRCTSTCSGTVTGANDVTLELTHKDFPAWELAASRVLYCFASCVSDQLLSYIRDAKTPKDAWVNLKKIIVASCEFHSSTVAVPTRALAATSDVMPALRKTAVE